MFFGVVFCMTQKGSFEFVGFFDDNREFIILLGSRNTERAKKQ